MVEAQLLAPQFELVRTRDNKCGGVFLASIRGFAPKSRPLPVTYVYKEATMTPEGTKAAQALLDCVKNENYHRVVLSGHTDQIGSDAYNMDLSAKRLATVKAFLVSGGITAEIVLIPKGKSEPFQVDDPGQHTPEEINQLNRRVELRETTQ